MSDPEIAILLTTYKRTECAVRTIESVRKNFRWGNISWWVSDDGSDKTHVDAVMSAIGPTYTTHFFSSGGRGVGYGMNHNLRSLFVSIDMVLVLEDDWELTQPLNVATYANTLLNHQEYGMIRFGYIFPNLLGYTISEESCLYWRLEPNQETYIFAGHPSLRHKRFHTAYGYYDEGLAPGMTELSMCGKVNLKYGNPYILYPALCGAYGFFAHTGSDSLADINPRKK